MGRRRTPLVRRARRFARVRTYSRVRAASGRRKPPAHSCARTANAPAAAPRATRCAKATGSVSATTKRPGTTLSARSSVVTERPTRAPRGARASAPPDRRCATRGRFVRATPTARGRTRRARLRACRPNRPRCPPLCAGGICVPGSRQCNVSQPQACTVEGTWLDDGAACPYICTGGTCTGTCTPGSTQCSGRTVQTCMGGTSGSRAPRCARSLAREARASACAFPGYQAMHGQRGADVCRRRPVHGHAVPVRLPAPRARAFASPATSGATGRRLSFAVPRGVDNDADVPSVCASAAPGMCEGVCNPGEGLHDQQVRSVHPTASGRRGHVPDRVRRRRGGLRQRRRLSAHR